MKLKDWLMDQPQDEPTNEDEKSSGENSKSKRRREMKTSPVKKVARNMSVQNAEQACTYTKSTFLKSVATLIL